MTDIAIVFVDHSEADINNFLTRLAFNNIPQTFTLSTRFNNHVLAGNVSVSLTSTNSQLPLPPLPAITFASVDTIFFFVVDATHLPTPETFRQYTEKLKPGQRFYLVLNKVDQIKNEEYVKWQTNIMPLTTLVDIRIPTQAIYRNTINETQTILNRITAGEFAPTREIRYQAQEETRGWRTLGVILAAIFLTPLSLFVTLPLWIWAKNNEPIQEIDTTPEEYVSFRNYQQNVLHKEPEPDKEEQNYINIIEQDKQQPNIQPLDTPEALAASLFGFQMLPPSKTPIKKLFTQEECQQFTFWQAEKIRVEQVVDNLTQGQPNRTITLKNKSSE